MKPLTLAAGKWLWFNGIWIVMAGSLAGLGYKIFSTYAEQFPYLSNDHTAWASFGSLLSGFFTITGTVATIATLLFLAKQNKSMQKVSQAQLDTLTFERYVNHRKLFIEQLNELEKSMNGMFRFSDSYGLYSVIFQDNSPHQCTISIMPEFNSRHEPINHIAYMIDELNMIKLFLEKDSFSDREFDTFVVALFYLRSNVLGLDFTGSPRVGDLAVGEKLFGLNIFAVDEFLVLCVKNANIILRFTNNSEFILSDFYTRPIISEKMMRSYFGSFNQGSLNVVCESKKVRALGEIYIRVQEVLFCNKLLFPVTVDKLWRVFRSVERVNNLDVGYEIFGVARVCLDEVVSVMDGIEQGSELYVEANKIRSLFGQIFN